MKSSLNLYNIAASLSFQGVGFRIRDHRVYADEVSVHRLPDGGTGTKIKEVDVTDYTHRELLEWLGY